MTFQDAGGACRLFFLHVQLAFRSVAGIVWPQRAEATGQERDSRSRERELNCSRVVLELPATKAASVMPRGSTLLFVHRSNLVL